MQRVATVLTVYGIETRINFEASLESAAVATVLTVYGIETLQCNLQANQMRKRCNSTYRLRY